MTRGWHGEPGRHAQAARGIKSGRHKQAAKPSLGYVYHDTMGVRVRDVPAASGVDAAIAEVIQALNDAGFKTAQSMSGLKVDYTGKGEGRYSPGGYMAFWKTDITEDQVRQIHRAARKAGMYVDDGPIWFSEAAVVRTGVFKSGRTRADLIEEANQLSGLRTGRPDFLERLPERDRILKRLKQEAGGYVSDAESTRMWEKFTKELTGKDVHVG